MSKEPRDIGASNISNSSSGGSPPEEPPSEGHSPRGPIVGNLLGVIIMMLLIIATLEISRRNLNIFISNQDKYILSIESSLLVIFVVEMLARLVTVRFRGPQMIEQSTRLRLIVRIVGYLVGFLSVISILASNPTLGISVGALAGVVIALATQNIAGNVLAALLILGSRIVRVGEDITISGNKGTVSDITLTHTKLSLEDEVIFIPNSVMISTALRRKKRTAGKDASVRDW